MTEEHGVSVTRACHAARLSRAAITSRAWIRWRETPRSLLRYRLWLLKILDGVSGNATTGCGHWTMAGTTNASGGMFPTTIEPAAPDEAKGAATRAPIVVRRSADGCRLGARPHAGHALQRQGVPDARRHRRGKPHGALGVDIAVSIPASRVIAFLAQLIDIHGRPQAIRCDNGPELTSQVFTDWCKREGIEIHHIQPGKPDRNANIERFNRTYREEVLSAYLFESLTEVRDLTEEWLDRYNEIRPHDALGSLPPARYGEFVLATRNSSFELST